MTHTVSVGEFEGPLGILLDLVERKKLEVTSISVGEITTAYLQRINNLKERSAEDIGEFLALGARLLYVKSLALLPTSTHQRDQAEELRQLELELDDYRRIKQAAQNLAARSHLQTWPRTATRHLTPADLPLPRIQLGQLATALDKALRRLPTPPRATIARQSVDPAMVMSKMRRSLDAGFNLDKLLAGCSNRLEIIVTFVCLLELIREGTAIAQQERQFHEITVAGA